MSNFENKVVLVTGGCGGLGLAISHAFLNAGANVVAIDIATDDGSEKWESNPKAKFERRKCDITDEAQLNALFERTVDEFGQIDVVVNNAGVMDRFDPVGTLDKDVWDRVIKINLTAPYMVSKLAVQHMLEKKTKGAIVNVSSLGAIKGFVAGAAYTASKHGLNGLTQNTAAFYGKDGIRCNAVLPGGMETNIASSFQHGYNQEGLQIAMERKVKMVQKEQVASAVLYLASDAAGAVSGVTMTVDGGWAAA